MTWNLSDRKPRVGIWATWVISPHLGGVSLRGLDLVCLSYPIIPTRRMVILCDVMEESSADSLQGMIPRRIEELQREEEREQETDNVS